MTTDRNPTNDRLDAFAEAVRAAFTGDSSGMARAHGAAAYLDAAITEVGLRPVLTTVAERAAYTLFVAYVRDQERTGGQGWRQLVAELRRELRGLAADASTGWSSPRNLSRPAAAATARAQGCMDKAWHTMGPCDVPAGCRWAADPDVIAATPRRSC